MAGIRRERLHDGPTRASESRCILPASWTSVPRPLLIILRYRYVDRRRRAVDQILQVNGICVVRPRIQGRRQREKEGDREGKGNCIDWPDFDEGEYHSGRLVRNRVKWYEPLSPKSACESGFDKCDWVE